MPFSERVAGHAPVPGRDELRARPRLDHRIGHTAAAFFVVLPPVHITAR